MKTLLSTLATGFPSIATRISSIVSAIIFSLSIFSSLVAVETQLQQGPDIMATRFGFETAQIDKGLYRSEELVLNAYAHGRWNNVGLTAETWMGMQDDTLRLVDSGDNTGLNGRLDYLFEKQDFFQLIPHIEVNYYPNLPSTVAEPVWLGVDFWYLLPWEGTEVGFSMDVDLDDTQGFYSSVAARQIFQHSPFDLLAWQSLNFGDKDFHKAYSGASSTGFTTVEFGAELTLPMPWEKTWIVFNAEYYYWLMSEDRALLANDSSFLMGVSFLYRDK
ncbi:MAG: hypothetical protein HRU15_21075 [Planctomycetes bacterium]|nr:hypothetical protein [Planctomycetota bacterium]